jgi:hypothetical protein
MVSASKPASNATRHPLQIAAAPHVLLNPAQVPLANWQAIERFVRLRVKE